MFSLRNHPEIREYQMSGYRMIIVAERWKNNYNESRNKRMKPEGWGKSPTIGMNKKEIAEIKKQYTQEKCPATKICGCYVDGEKKKQAEFRQAFLSLPDEEFFKYLNIFRKAMSGTIGKNLLTMEFPLDTEMEGGTQELLMKLKATELKDDGILGRIL